MICFSRSFRFCNRFVDIQALNLCLLVCFSKPKVRTVLSPAWTTDWMSEDGRRKLREYGIAPPAHAGCHRALFGVEQVACPQCGSLDTELISEFGSTSCKALWRCRDCREPFDYFKCH